MLSSIFSNNHRSLVWGEDTISLKRLAKPLATGIAVFLLLVGMHLPAVAACPSYEKLKADIERLTSKKGEILSVRPSAVPSLCEVVMLSDSQKRVFYTDSGGGFFIFGSLVDVAASSNLSQKTLAEFNLMKKQDLEELEFYTAFSIGDESAPFLYYVTDPQCPYCKRGEQDLKQLAADGKIHVRFLMFPLESHKGALAQCVSVVCDGKGLEEFENGYRSENQCEDGRMQIESGRDFLRKQGINATPTYIFSDGRFHSGLLKMPDLMQRLKPPQPHSNETGTGSTAGN